MGGVLGRQAAALAVEEGVAAVGQEEGGEGAVGGAEHDEIVAFALAEPQFEVVALHLLLLAIMNVPHVKNSSQVTVEDAGVSLAQRQLPLPEDVHRLLPRLLHPARPLPPPPRERRPPLAHRHRTAQGGGREGGGRGRGGGRGGVGVVGVVGVGEQDDLVDQEMAVEGEGVVGGGEGAVEQVEGGGREDEQVRVAACPLREDSFKIDAQSPQFIQQILPVGVQAQFGRVPRHQQVEHHLPVLRPLARETQQLAHASSSPLNGRVPRLPSRPLQHDAQHDQLQLAQQQHPGHRFEQLVDGKQTRQGRTMCQPPQVWLQTWQVSSQVHSPLSTVLRWLVSRQRPGLMSTDDPLACIHSYLILITLAINSGLHQRRLPTPTPPPHPNSLHPPLAPTPPYPLLPPQPSRPSSPPRTMPPHPSSRIPPTPSFTPQPSQIRCPSPAHRNPPSPHPPSQVRYLSIGRLPLKKIPINSIGSYSKLISIMFLILLLDISVHFLQNSFPAFDFLLLAQLHGFLLLPHPFEVLPAFGKSLLAPLLVELQLLLELLHLLLLLLPERVHEHRVASALDVHPLPGHGAQVQLLRAFHQADVALFQQLLRGGSYFFELEVAAHHAFVAFVVGDVAGLRPLLEEAVEGRVQGEREGGGRAGGSLRGQRFVVAQDVRLD